MLPRSQLTLAINAGGRGERLGGLPKGLIKVDGQTVLERLLVLSGLASETIVIANDGAYAHFGLRTVADEVPDRGAPGGVVTALGAARTPWVLVVACDMPFVTREIVEALITSVDETVDVVCASRGGSLEPLLGVYRAALHDGWKAQLEQEPALRRLVSSARLRAIEVDARALDSLNAPEDLIRHKAK